MNLHNDLAKVKISHSCKNCICNGCRCSNQGLACENFYPEHTVEFMRYVLSCIHEGVIPSQERRLKRHATHGASYNDKIGTLDDYYVILVNSVLDQIRKGGVDYAYTLEQVRDVMRFEPDIIIRYIPEAGAYEVRLDR